MTALRPKKILHTPTNAPSAPRSACFENQSSLPASLPSGPDLLKDRVAHVLDIKHPQEQELVRVLPDGSDELSLLSLGFFVRLGQVDDLGTRGTG